MTKSEIYQMLLTVRHRERIQLSWAQLNTAGARNAYRFHARSVDADVLDADAYGPEDHSRPGEVDVYVLSRTGDGKAPQTLLDKTSANLSADEVRPLTDFVSVKSAVIQRYSITAELEIPDGPDAQTVLDNAISVATSYAALSHRIKTVIPLSAVYAALQQPGVVRVRLAPHSRFHWHFPTAWYRLLAALRIKRHQLGM